MEITKNLDFQHISVSSGYYAKCKMSQKEEEWKIKNRGFEMEGLLEDKVAVVTGGGRGLGRAMCLLMAKEGAKLVVNDLGGTERGTGFDMSPSDEVVAEIKNQGGVAVANYDSVASWDGGEAIIKAAVDNFGRIDILVNNAGIVRDRMIFNMTVNEWDTVMKVNLYGSFYCTRHASALMRQQKGGRIIFMSSNAVQGITPGQPNYSAAKAGILGLCQTCAASLYKYGITCNAIWPHADTRLTLSDEVRQKREKGEIPVPQGKRDPEVVAPMVVFLASGAAANINGQIFEVSGNEVSLISWPPKQVKTVFNRRDVWEVSDLSEQIPHTFASDLVNPATPRK